MTSGADDAVLDAVLAVQLTVAWAGEGRCEPKRLGWWDTDVLDAESQGLQPAAAHRSGKWRTIWTSTPPTLTVAPLKSQATRLDGRRR